jgi:hypothetical protein
VDNKILALFFSRDFRFDFPVPAPLLGRPISLCKGFNRYWSTVFPAAPEGAGFASGEPCNAEKKGNGKHPLD